MMKCETFRAQFVPGTEETTMLEHLRSCDACLNFAVERDDDVLFRAIGGDEIVPPGGVDAFVDDVMREVRLRSTENTVAAHFGWPRKLAAAAALTAVLAGSSFVYRHQSPGETFGPIAHHKFQTQKPVVQSYDSDKATIVEVPSESEDVTVVMVFDDSLPADL
jgi:hypothetical protein